MMHYTCVPRNLTKDNSIVYGDGSTKVFCSMVVETSINKILGVEKYGSNDFSERISTYNPSIQ
jgi:T-complex protein 1 subunit epsilon